MKSLIFLLVLLSLTITASAQDSSRLGKGTQDKINHELDSLSQLASVSRVTDSLKINKWSDSLNARINSTFAPVRVTRYMDSLQRKGVATRKLKFYSDSLAGKKYALLKEVSTNQQRLRKKLNDRYEGWTSSLRKRFNTDSAGIKIPGAGLSNTKLPAIPGADIPGVPSLNSTDFAGLTLSPELKQVGGSFAIPSTDQLNAMDLKVPGYSNPLNEYQSKVGDVKNEFKDPGKAAEQRVSQLAEFQEIDKQAGMVNELKNNEAMQTAEQLKGADSPEALLPVAVDHFAGKEVVLQQAMDQMAKYKEKYPSLPSIADVKKTWWPHNGLKGVSFRERFRLGFNLGVKNTKDTLFVDLHPNASYRISGRFEAGLGLMYRLRVQTNHFGFDQQHPVWGMTSFVVAKTFKSVFLRIELDGTSVPKAGGSDNTIHRDWRWSFLSGIQTNFRIATQWTGNVQMLYNFDTSLKDKFPEQLVLRVGVQYKLKAR